MARSHSALGDLVDGRLASQLLLQQRGRLAHLLQDFRHVLGDANQRCLLLQRAGDGLADPPSGVGAESAAAIGVELRGGAQQPEIALLDEVD
jgi:hypothetical protein